MTREEAIEFGNMWIQINEDCKDSNTYAFFQKAIKALELGSYEDIEVRKIDEWEIQGKIAELWIVKGNLQVRYLGTIHNIPLPPV